VPFTLRNIRRDLDDIGSRFDGAPDLEFRAATKALELEKSSVSYQRIPPGYRFPYGHTHVKQEEVYVVLRGSGRMKLDDEIVELKEWDAVRVPPGTWRGYEAGPEGLEILVIGAPNLGEDPREDVDGRRDWWAVREGTGQLVLREVEDRDLGVLFEHSRDREAIRMAAFTSPEADDRRSFERRWARLRSDSSTTNRVVEIDGRVVGHIASFDLEGQREVTYWIGREDWGRGIATRALQELLQLEATRPLYARAATDNAASIRVLTKCGFLTVGEGREFAHGRNEETDEVVLRLDA
jgi:RimJ/RimL family protein N-acetyltransferase/mannose-6-phosphate isomerase-like protein (cupin superfamily)